MRHVLLLGLVLNAAVGAYVYVALGQVPVISIITEAAILVWFVRELSRRRS